MSNISLGSLSWRRYPDISPPDISPQPRFLPSLQLLVKNELFHQFRFYLKNIVSSVQLLFKKSYLHFSSGEKSGGKCPRRNVLDPCRQWWTINIKNGCRVPFSTRS